MPQPQYAPHHLCVRGRINHIVDHVFDQARLHSDAVQPVERLYARRVDGKHLSIHIAGGSNVPLVHVCAGLVTKRAQLDACRLTLECLILSSGLLLD